MKNYRKSLLALLLGISMGLISCAGESGTVSSSASSSSGSSTQTSQTGSSQSSGAPSTEASSSTSASDSSSTSSSESTEAGKPTTFELKALDHALTIGDEVELVANVLPVYADQAFTLTSSDPSKVSVKDHTITAEDYTGSKDPVTVTATNSYGQTSSIKVYVYERTKKITVAADETKLTVGDYADIDIDILPKEADPDVTLVSSDPSALQVFENKRVYALNYVGKPVTVTAISSDGRKSNEISFDIKQAAQSLVISIQTDVANTLSYNSEVTPVVTVNPFGADQTGYQLVSSNPKIIKVEGDKLKAVGITQAGETVDVYATLGNLKSNVLKLSVNESGEIVAKTNQEAYDYLTKVFAEKSRKLEAEKVNHGEIEDKSSQWSSSTTTFDWYKDRSVASSTAYGSTTTDTVLIQDGKLGYIEKASYSESSFSSLTAPDGMTNEEALGLVYFHGKLDAVSIHYLGVLKEKLVKSWGMYNVDAKLEYYPFSGKYVWSQTDWNYESGGDKTVSNVTFNMDGDMFVSGTYEFTQYTGSTTAVKSSGSITATLTVGDKSDYSGN